MTLARPSEPAQIPGMERTPLPPFSFSPSLLSDAATAREIKTGEPCLDPLAYARIVGPMPNALLDDVTFKPTRQA